MSAHKNKFIKLIKKILKPVGNLLGNLAPILTGFSMARNNKEVNGWAN